MKFIRLLGIAGVNLTAFLSISHATQDAFLADILSAKTPPSKCEALLTELRTLIGHGVGFESPDEIFLHHAPKEASVAYLRTLRDKSEAEYLIYQLITQRWLSEHRSNPYDPQGDPRWFIESLGRTTSRYFGFELLDSKTIKLPSAATFIKAIAYNNFLLAVRFPELSFHGGFYEQTQNSMEHYLDRFIHEGKIPIAKGPSNHFLHDLSFHTGFLFIPSDTLNYSRELHNYFRYAFSQIENTLNLPEKLKQHFAKFFRLELVEGIDVATVMFTTAMIRHNRLESNPSDMEYHPPELVFQKALKTMHLLEFDHYRPSGNLRRILLLSAERLFEQLKKERISPVELEKIKVSLNSQIRSFPFRDIVYTPQFFSNFDPNAMSPINYAQECQKITQLRMAVIGALK